MFLLAKFIILFFVLITFSTIKLSAQPNVDTIPENSHKKLNHSIRSNILFVELGGSAPDYSLNYCRTTRLTTSLNLSVRAGIGTQGDFDVFFGVGPLIGISADWFGKANHFETGLALSNMFVREESDANNLSAIVGYKYHDPNHAFFFRISLTPYYYNQPGFESRFKMWGGISFGVALK